LKDKYKPFKDFTSFSEDDLPTNSDVVFIVAQYLGCMEKLRADNIRSDLGNWVWVIDGKSSSIRTAPPKKIREK
jgi:hypothetical protein